MNINEINIIYNNIKQEKEIKIFGEKFVKANKTNCKIIYKDNEYELKDKFSYGWFDTIKEKLDNDDSDEHPQNI